MGRLRVVDIAAFSRALTILHAQGDLASLPFRITDCLHALFACDFASFDLFDESASKWSTVTVSPALERFEHALPVLQAHAHEHPIVGHATRNSDATAIRTSDLLSLRQYRRTALYNEFFRRHLHTDRQLGFVAKPSPTLTVGASVNRAGRDFSGEEQTLLEHLRSHLVHAYATAQSMSRLSNERETTATLTNGALCQIDADGKIYWMTTDLPRILARHFPNDSIKAGHLPNRLIGALKETQAIDLITSERAIEATRALEFVCGAATLVVQLAAKDECDRWQLMLTEDRPDPSATELSKRHGLSLREGEVLQWMREGKTCAEIGIILGISSRTVEKHVERLYEKLGVYNRQSAIRLALDRSSQRKVLTG